MNQGPGRVFIACCAIGWAALFAVPVIAHQLSITQPAETFVNAERFERNAGGAGTYRGLVDADAFSHPGSNLSFEGQSEFQIGNAIFTRAWVSSPSSTAVSDGLGPLFNARGCQRCHLKDGRGHPPEANYPEDNAISMLMRLSIPPQNDAQRALLESGQASSIPDPVYGGQLQDLSIQGFVAEGRIHTEWMETSIALAGGETASLRSPTYSIATPAFGAHHDELMMSVRVAPPMIGLGLLEAISETDVLAHADPEDADGDGISGRSNYVWNLEQGSLSLGRFGWKASQPTLNQQNSGAFNGDIGMSSPLVPVHWGDCTAAQTECQNATHGNSAQYENLEIHSELVDALLFYTRNLAVPARRNAGDPQVLTGKALFYSSGCTSCHMPKFVTDDDAATPELSHQLIWPYSDLLLHDMGEGLADNRPDGQATGVEWRTPPLWGIGLTETVNGHTYFLHDGRARNLTEAVLWHGGEAQPSRDAFTEMSPEERAALLAFLESL